MRQVQDQLDLVKRNGSIQKKDWIDLNNVDMRYENELPKFEQNTFRHNRLITLMETQNEVNGETHNKLETLSVPVAIVLSTGSGYHHVREMNQCGQIMRNTYLADGLTVNLTKNQLGLTYLCLNLQSEK